MILPTFKITDHFVEYHLTMTEEQRKYILRRIEKDATNLQHGIDNKDPNLVEPVYNNVTYINKFGENWYCSSCPYRNRCAGYKEFNTPQDETAEIKKQVEELKQLLSGYHKV